MWWIRYEWIGGIEDVDNAQKSVDYLKEVVMSPEFIPAGLKVSVMVVSQDNYRVLLQKRELQAYEDFFKETYK